MNFDALTAIKTSSSISPETSDPRTPFTLEHVDALRRRHGEAIDVFFDSNYYASSYPDLAIYKQDLLLHFCNHGFREGRNPSPVVSNGYCRWLARRRGTALKTAADLFALAEDVTSEDVLGTHVLFSPRWIAMQLGLDRQRVTSLHQLLRMEVTDKPLSLHPALPPMHLPPSKALWMSLAALDSVAVAAASLLDLNDYVRRHNDLTGLASAPLRIFEHAWMEGLHENRLKYLGTSAPRWASSADLFEAAAVLILRRLAEPLLLNNLTRLRTLPQEAIQRLPVDGEDIKAFQEFSLTAAPRLPSLDLLLKLNTVAAIGKPAMVVRLEDDTAERAPARLRPREITDQLLLSGRRTTTQRVVYSVCLGGYDDLPQAPDLPDSEAFLITDSPAWNVPAGWNVVRPTLSERDTKRLCLWYKTHPHKLFPAARHVTWMDANIDCLPGSGQILAAHEALSEVATFQHPDRGCIYEEAHKVIELKLDDKAVVELAMARMRKAGMPERFGAFETNVLFSQCSDPAVRAFFDRWWREIFHGSRRDQVSFTFAAWASRIHVSALDGNRSAKDSRCFTKRPHQSMTGRKLA